MFDRDNTSTINFDEVWLFRGLRSLETEFYFIFCFQYLKSFSLYGNILMIGKSVLDRSIETTRAQ
jgi:hypothetical protein